MRLNALLLNNDHVSTTKLHLLGHMVSLTLASPNKVESRKVSSNGSSVRRG